MLSFFIAVCGLLMNRIRGGGLTVFSWDMNWTREGDSSFTKSAGKIGNDLVFALLFSAFLFSEIGVPFLLSVAILFLAMWGGRSVGWGTYIGGMIDKKVSGDKEVEIIDKLVLGKTDHPVLRNTAALSLRGLFWSFCLVIGFALVSFIAYIPLTFLLILPIGLLMGPIYLLAMTICERHQDAIRGFGWSIGEYLWGFVLWGSCATLIFGA